MSHYVATFPTLCGPFSVAFDFSGAVVATAFGELSCLRARLLPSDDWAPATPDSVREVKRQVEAYFAGTLTVFSLPLAAGGTAFQHRVWAALSAIPRGQTRSYGEVAADLGQSQASRAVGRATGANPLCLIVPCHRVIGADGSLGGFAFGIAVKRQLLMHEGVTGLR